MIFNIGYHLSKNGIVPDSVLSLIDRKKFNLIIQSFVSSPQSGLLPKSITPDEIPKYTGLIHGKYLYNLNKKYPKQTKMLNDEILLAKSLGCPLVLHTKSYTPLQAEQIVNSIKTTKGTVYIENNASVSITDFNILVDNIIKLLPTSINFGIVIDLAHLYGSGDYDKLDSINWKLVKVIHFNPSSVEYNSKKDRHLPVFPKKNLSSIEPILSYVLTKVKKYNITLIAEKLPNSEESQLLTIKYFLTLLSN